MRKSRKNKTSGALGGSKTDAGKARSSLNALKHGRFSRQGSLLKYECDRTFPDIYRGLLSAWAPANHIEASLVQQLAHIECSLFRCRAIETSLLESAYDRQDHAFPGLPPSIAASSLRTLGVYRKLPSEPTQLSHSKRNKFDSNPKQTPRKPPSDPERTASEPLSDPIRTTPQTPSNS